MNWQERKALTFVVMTRFWERLGILSPYRRLIIVTGMARSGTSIVSAYLGTHSEVKLVVGGPLWWQCENEILSSDASKTRWDIIDELLAKYPTKRILLKRPWIEGQVELFKKAFWADVIVCRCQKEKLFGSWRKTQHVSQAVKENPLPMYEKHSAYADALERNGALRIDRDSIPTLSAERLGDFLNLDPDGFNQGRLMKVWHNKAEKDFLKVRAIWREI